MPEIKLGFENNGQKKKRKKEAYISIVVNPLYRLSPNIVYDF